MRIYSTKDFKEMCYSPLIAHSYAITYVSFDPKEQYLSTASSDGSSKLWILDDTSAKVSLSVLTLTEFL